MSARSFGSGAIDLSQLKATTPAPSAPGVPGASYVTTADDRSFEAALGKSMQHPVVFEFNSPRANAAQLSADLADLANAAGGKWLLVRVDIEAAPQIVAALGIQAVPFVVAAIGGQLVPLFQGTAAKNDIAAALDQVVQAAAANGIIGRAQPVAGKAAPEGEDAAPAEDPRFAAADAAMDAGDYELAVAEFDKVLAQTPGDPEAQAGKAGAEMLARTASVTDPMAVLAAAQAAPDDIDAQLAAADVLVLGGQAEAGLKRLIDVVRVTAGDDRERVRVRLLSLFEALGAADPVVVKARRDLMAALF